jgi:uncharacterized membrane protein
MPDASDSADRSERGGSLYKRVRQTLLTGLAITVPVIVTIYVLTIALDFVTKALGPFIAILEWLGVIGAFERIEVFSLLVELGLYSSVVGVFTELVAIVVLFGIIAVVGAVGHNRYGEQVIDYIDVALAAIPGVGTVYKSFRRMGDVMLDENGENFQEIKLIQCFDDDVYVIGFKTSDAPETIETSTGHEEMVAMFLPLAPNPVTGGFLTYVPESKIYDIDMTIEEGVRSILTSGIATGEGTEDRTALTMGNLKQVADFETLQGAIQDDDTDEGQ